MNRPIVFGEILFDRFPDGSHVMSGAPFNVCSHLQLFGLQPLMVTRIGDDAAGEDIRRVMRDEGFDLAGVQTDPSLPTGEVQVTVGAEGEPSFEIPSGQAWDAIEPCASEATSLVYTGTLALRTPESRQRFLDWQTTVGAPLFVDANLRKPWWEKESLLQVIERAACLKCNDKEFELLFGDRSPREVLAHHQLDLLILTMGSKGVQLYAHNDVASALPPPLDGPVVDTVGAGDSVAAVAILGFIQRWPLQDIADRAVIAGARMCRIRGGRPDTSIRPA